MPTYTQKSSAQLSTTQARSDDTVKAGGILELGIVLDQSHSMNSLANEAIAAFIALADEQRGLKGADNQEFAFSFALFNDAIQVLHDALPMAEAPLLSHELTSPRVAPHSMTRSVQ